MRLSRIITAVAVGLAVVGAPAAAGAAQPVTPQPSSPPQATPLPPYPPQPPALTATELTVEVGEPVTLIGNGFGPDEQVRLTFTQLSIGQPGGPATPAGTGAMAPLAAAPVGGPARPPLVIRADGEGTFRRTVRFDEPGEVQVVARGLRTGRTATLVLTVVARPGGAPGGAPLPVTGDSITPQLTIGAGAVAAGLLLLVLGLVRRRRRIRPTTGTV